MSEEKINDANTIESVVDHHPDNITKENQKIAEDIIELLRENLKKEIPLKFSIEQIENNYHIKEIPTMNVENSLWYQMTKDWKIGANIQGYRQTVKDGKKIRIPFIGMGADLDYLDKVLKEMITKIHLSKEDK
tara:strand:- start:1539 stop:1937 length:399 start_codon:yes stop_codon:yes gene_type:complete